LKGNFYFLFAAKEKLKIVNFLDGTIRIFCPPDPSPPQAGEDRIPFELSSEYTVILRQGYGRTSRATIRVPPPNKSMKEKIKWQEKMIKIFKIIGVIIISIIIWWLIASIANFLWGDYYKNVW